MSSPDLSIIIVNWNSKDYLQSCILSILNNTHNIKFEIIVIDNASFDGCGEMLEPYYPQVTFIQSDKNLGFAKANNEAFKVSTGRVVVFLNPDTEVKNSSLEILYHEINFLQDAGILGAKLLNSDGSIQTSCIQSFPTIMNQVFNFAVLRKIFPRLSLWGTAPLFLREDKWSEVDAVSGACLMIKRSIFEKVGMFCEDYFMYSEDIDLCFNVHKAGFKNYFIPKAVIIHHGAKSSKNSPVSAFASVMILESQWRFFRKTRTIWYCYTYAFAMFLVSLLRTVFFLFLWPVFKMCGQGTLVKNVLKKWTARLRWTLGLESWSKKY